MGEQLLIKSKVSQLIILRTHAVLGTESKIILGNSEEISRIEQQIILQELRVTGAV